MASLLTKARKELLWKAILSVFTVLILFYLLSPIIGIFLASIHTEAELHETPPHWIPKKPSFINYIALVKKEARDKLPLYPDVMDVFPRSFLNNTIVALSATILSLTFGSLSAYSLARVRFKGSKYLTFMILATRMLPLLMIVIPIYIIARRSHLLNSLLGLIIVYTGIFTPYAVWILRGFFQQLPRDLEDSAMVDGCTKLGALVRIVLPLSAPGLAATGVIIFLFSWNQFLIPMIIASSKRSTFVLPVVVGFASTEHLISHSLLSAIGMVALIPTLLLAIFLRKYIISGLTRGAFK